jgi:hypothetical protein
VKLRRRVPAGYVPARTLLSWSAPKPNLKIQTIALLVIGYSDCLRSGLLVVCGKLRRTEFEGYLVDLAIEWEWHLIVLIVHSSTGIYADALICFRYWTASSARSVVRL